MITVRKSTLGDNKDFTELVLISAPYFPILFGDKIKTVLQDLFHYHFNLFSFEHVYFAEVDGEKAGMILGYDWQVKKREDLRTGFLLFKKIGVSILCKFSTLMKFNATVGSVCDGEYYISNIATYPQHRGLGVGKRLILEAEQEAKVVGAERILLDVEKENISAIDFYKKLGYKTIKEFSIPLQRNKILHFNRMTKEVK
uniref:GNAT family N-acetyltransferase n=1 Tax=candidate division WOR-3 bacterium TaxID=2052148 RepID=A0A7C4U6Z7_UNCW3